MACANEFDCVPENEPVEPLSMVELWQLVLFTGMAFAIVSDAASSSFLKANEEIKRFVLFVLAVWFGHAAVIRWGHGSDWQTANLGAMIATAVWVVAFTIAQSVSGSLSVLGILAVP